MANKGLILPGLALSTAAPKLPAMGDYKAAALAIPGIVGYWALDESTGPALDGSGNGRDGPRSGATYITPQYGTPQVGLGLGARFTGGGTQACGFTPATPLTGLGANAKANGISFAVVVEGLATGSQGTILGMNDSATNGIRLRANTQATSATDAVANTTNVASWTTITYKNGTITRALCIRNPALYDGGVHLICGTLVTAGAGSNWWTDGVVETQLGFSYNATLTDTTTPAEFLIAPSIGNQNANGTLANGLQGVLRGVALWSGKLTSAQALGLYRALTGTAT